MKPVAAFLAIFLICARLGVADDPPEVRAFYAATFDINTQAKCDAIIAAALSRNVNQIFVEVRGRADAYYYPNREDATYPNSEPRGQLYTISPSNLDVLQHFIDRCHAATPRVEVHAWCTTMNSWNRATPPTSPLHVYNASPEWITENSAGVTYTHADDAPLDPGIPAVRDHIVNVFMDIVRNYDVDGIHFDYVRLLGANSGYDPVALAQFQAETGWAYDPASPGALGEVYEAWRRDRISQIVQRVTELTRLEKPWVDVSAFLVNFSDSVEVLAQGYNWWVHHDAIDVLHPGCYSSTIAGTVADWDFFVAKLAQAGDQSAVPMVCAVGDYLLTDPGENASAVTTVRGNARPPDGFNFFDYGSLFVDGPTRVPAEPADQHAQNLFNAGGPMDEWAPVPVITNKVALGEETVPPNAPASLSATLVGGRPRITFSRPAAAGDGDLPVHYRLYRSTANPVPLYHDNMVMEWWDPGSPRATFTFDDVTAPAGTHRYAAVAYDNWNNQAVATSGAVVVASGGDYIIETRPGMLNVGDYSEPAGSFSDSTSHSTAPGCTNPAPSPATRFATPGTDGSSRLDRQRFTPSGLVTGTYAVHVTTPGFGSSNAQNITVRISDADGVSTSLFNLTNANCGNVWTQCGTMAFTQGAGHFVEFDNATQSNFGDATNSRMNAAAVRLVRTDVTPKEPKPPISVPESLVTEVIVDSTPQALDYDDRTDAEQTGSNNHWQTSTLAGYYGANARFYSNTFTFPPASVAVWIVDLPRSGRWAIDGWVRNNTAFASGAQYRFVDRTGTVRNVTTTQQAPPDNTATGGWFIDVDGVSDANAYEFDEGRVFITLHGNSAGAQTLIADALRFRYLGPTIPAGITMLGQD